MKKGTIAKILDYYFSQKKFSDDIETAMLQFLDIDSVQVLRKRGVAEKELEFFSEWFVFNYQLTVGKTPLVSFYEQNPLGLSPEELQVYKDLQTNHYGLWKVLAVTLGAELELRNLQTGEQFMVKEHNATFELQPKDLFYARIARVGDHWELVGANSFILGVKFSKNVEKSWRNDISKLSPKDTCRLYTGVENREEVFDDDEPQSMVHAEAVFQQVLKDFKLDSYVTIPTIKDWIYNLKSDAVSQFEILDRLVGLINFDDLDEERNLQQLAEAFHDLHNQCPQKRLKGKSPQQMRSQIDSRQQDILMDESPIGQEGIGELYDEAYDCLSQGENWKAVKKFDQLFRRLLKRRTTVFYIYRIYANLATCYLYAGQSLEGKKMIDIALSLNPNYDFGQRLLKRYQAGEFPDITTSLLNYDSTEKLHPRPANRRSKGIDAILKRRELGLIKNPAVAYYNFLRSLNINFKTDKLTNSNIKVYGPTGEVKLGRNQLCSCGSGKKYKKCHL